MDTLKEFSKALIQARQRKGATQEEIAWHLGLSHATYNAWECGHRLCPYKHIISLINYFKDDEFTSRMVRILLHLQHKMAGLDALTKEELTFFYENMIRILSTECRKWLNEN